jgi:hypothetical protein
MRYTLQDFEKVSFLDIDYKLPESIILTITKLASEIGVLVGSKQSSESITNENSHKKNNGFGNKKNRGFQRRENINDLWETEKVFKPTKIEKKDGTEKLLNDIRTCLNKISSKNYEVQRDAIFENIDKIISDDSSDDESNSKSIDIGNITNAIFEIASTNKFYSELYATLYKELSVNFAKFRENIDSVIDDYRAGIANIQFVDPNVDYDKFCDNNKVNDKRKALTAFIVNLTKQNVIEKEKTLQLIKQLLCIVMESADIENKKYEVEEITENIYLFVTLSISDLKEESSWNEILSSVKTLSQYKVKDHLSITSRSVFKYMDIIDQLNKAV